MICSIRNKMLAVFILFIHSVFICSAGQDLFRIADSLRLAGQFDYAVIEYERVYFYAEDVSARASALLKKADCLKAVEKFDMAEKCLMRINYFGLDDSFTYQARYHTALCAYLARHFTNAESQLMQMFVSGSLKNPEFKTEALPIYTLVLNELQKWDEAKQKFHEWVSFLNLPQHVKDSLDNHIENLYSEKNQPKLKKQGTAKILSSIIPGSGQVYAGYFREGVANAFFQGAALLLTAYGIYTGYYITSVVVSFGLFQKFYAGAIVRTEYLVEKKNYELTRRYNDALKKEIISIQQLL